MRALWLLALALLISPAHAQIGSPSGANVGNHGPICPGNGALCGPVPASVAYTGAGDQATFTYWGSCTWAYSAATRGQAACNVCNASDVTCSDITTDATTGLVPASISIGGTNCTGGACTVKIIYDKTGNSLNYTQGTIASRATLTNSGCPTGAPWCLSFGSSTSYAYAGTGPAVQPFSATFVINSTSGTAYEVPLGVPGTTPFTQVIFNSAGGCANGQICLYSNGLGPAVAFSTSTWYALQAIFNGASPNSIIYLNGASTTGSTSGSSWGSAGAPAFPAAGDPFLGTMTEMGWATSAFSGTVQTNLNSNERSRNNF